MRRLITALAFLAAAGCGGERSASPEGFIRAPAPGMDMAAAYVTVASETDDRLVRAEVEGVEKTEMHTVLNEGGVMKMRPVSGYVVAGGGTLVLQPGGDHLMLFGLGGGLEIGETRDLVLTFESGRTEVVPLKVKAGTRR